MTPKTSADAAGSLRWGSSSLPRGEAGRLAVLVVVIALVVRLVPAAMIYGSDDVSSWLNVSDALVRGHNPYETGTLNWPPLWPAMVLYSTKAAGIYRLPLVFSIKLTPILADTCIALALFIWLLKRGRVPTVAFKGALWAALNPVSIFTVSFHGQFDSFPALFAMLAVMAATEHHERQAMGFSWPAALWLGLGGFAKTWPLLLLPVCLRATRSIPLRILCAAVAIAPAIVSVAALYLAAPTVIQKYVLSYRSSPGWYGLTTLLHLVPRERWDTIAPLFQYILYAAIVFVLWRSWRWARPRELACLLLLTFYVFTPGFGLQYLFWMVPIGLVAEDPRTLVYTVIAGITIGVQYLFRPWDGGAMGQFLVPAFDRTLQFAAAYGQARDMLITCYSEMPLWVFMCWWWWRALIDAGKKDGSESGTEKPAMPVGGKPR